MTHFQTKEILLNKIVYSISILKGYMSYNISHIEMSNVITFQIEDPSLDNKQIQKLCDSS